MATAKPQKSLLSKYATANIGSWNIQGGLRSAHDSELLMADCEKHNLSVCAFQETHCEPQSFSGKNGKIICLNSETPNEGHSNYGQGFYISNQWLDYLWGIKRINNRISVIRFRTNKYGDKKVNIVIINVYAPTSKLTKTDPEITESFYQQLNSTIETYKKHTHLLIIAGDFNAKIGQKLDETEFYMGSYGKGTRNNNGYQLASFLTDSNLYLTNTTFKCSLKNRTTWSSYIQDKPRFNQIDYIALQKRRLIRYRGILQNSKSFENTIFPSDHRLIITTLNFKAIHRVRYRELIIPPQPQEKLQFDRVHKDISILGTNEDLKTNYQQSITEDIQSYTPEQREDLNTLYSELTKTLIKAVTRVCPNKPDPLSKKVQFSGDPLLQTWSIQRKLIQKKLIRTSKNRRNNLTHIRNILQKNITSRINYLQNEKLNHIAKTLEENKGNKRCFEAQRLLKRHSYTAFQLIDENGNMLHNPTQLIPLVHDWYTKIFSQQGIGPPQCWDGEPRPLSHPITPEEVSIGASKLKNGRAIGPDGLEGEL